MNKDVNKPTFFKRVVAYVIDMFVVLLLSSMIVYIINGGNNRDAAYFDNLRILNEKVKVTEEKYKKEEITKEEYDELYKEYLKESDDLYYNNVVDTVDVSIATASISLVYYVILCYFCHGITLGKYIMKLRIVSANDKELNLGHYLIRGLLVNLILSNLINITFVYSMSKETFLSIYPKLSSALSIFLLVTILFIMYREDGRGLHDLLSNTKVISTKGLKNNIKEKDIVEEAKVIEEKQLADKKKAKKKKEVKKK